VTGGDGQECISDSEEDERGVNTPKKPIPPADHDTSGGDDPSSESDCAELEGAEQPVKFKIIEIKTKEFSERPVYVASGKSEPGNK